MTFRFLSFGAGTQSTALLLTGEFDEVIFANTGNEFPGTYAFIESYVKPYCEKNVIKFTTVQAKETLEEFCLRRKTIPSFKYRFSTRDFKVRPIVRYLKKSGVELPCICVVGISTDEIERARNKGTTDWNLEYPLLERSMSRKDCEKIIRKFGWPIPPKSGCFFCPFLRKAQLDDLYFNHQEDLLWTRYKEIEQNGKNYPRAVISHLGLSAEELAKEFSAGPMKLDKFLEMAPCETGHCFT